MGCFRFNYFEIEKVKMNFTFIFKENQIIKYAGLIFQEGKVPNRAYVPNLTQRHTFMINFFVTFPVPRANIKLKNNVQHIIKHDEKYK